MSIKAATEDVDIVNNGAVGASQAANMLDFEELSDIVRSVRSRPAYRRMQFKQYDPCVVKDHSVRSD